MEAMPFQPRTMRWQPLVACLPLLKLCYGYKMVRYELSSLFSLLRTYMYTENRLVLADTAIQHHYSHISSSSMTCTL